MARLFDNKVQELKYKVLLEVAYQTWLGNESFSVFNEIANEIVKKDEPPTSCCIYKDRAIVADRIRIALGGIKENRNTVQVINIACDECPQAGHVVTDLCRGCIAHQCEAACKVEAIKFGYSQKAEIDKSKCVECGKCAEVCPYDAIMNFKRPCEKACKVGAITMARTGEAQIDYDKCVSCGACVYHCPFGATVDASHIVHIIDDIKASNNNEDYHVYGIVAPSISNQFDYAELGQIIAAIKEIGFYQVHEVAKGADYVAYAEAQELAEKGFLTSSCCPAFVKYVKNKFPELEGNISHNLSPMGELARRIKEDDPTSKVVFIGPCIAKKAEVASTPAGDYVDHVMTYEELQALIDSKHIDVDNLEPINLDEASYFGRVFGKSGGLTEAVTQVVKELGLEKEGFEFKPTVCNGVDAVKPTLLRAKVGRLNNNFIEGMFCNGGCVGGKGNLDQDKSSTKGIDAYSQCASCVNVTESVQKNWNE